MIVGGGEASSKRLCRQKAGAGGRLKILGTQAQQKKRPRAASPAASIKCRYNLSRVVIGFLEGANQTHEFGLFESIAPLRCKTFGAMDVGGLL